MNKIYYIENGLPYVNEDKLFHCGCGGEAKVDFHFNGKNFCDVEIYCKQCGIGTGIKENIDEAIKTWQNAFKTNHFHNKFCYEEDNSIGGFHN